MNLLVHSMLNSVIGSQEFVHCNSTEFNFVWFGGLQDTAGQERFHSLGPIYYRDADGEATYSSYLGLHQFRHLKFSVTRLLSYLGWSRQHGLLRAAWLSAAKLCLGRRAKELSKDPS